MGVRRGRGRPAFNWRAVFANVRMPGRVTTGGTMEARGTLHLSMVLVDAGVSSGREVDVTFGPDDLDALYALVKRARRERDR